MLMNVLEFPDGSIKGSKLKFIEELEMSQYKKWQDIYKEIGAVQTNPSAFVQEAVPVLKKYGVKRVLDLGCGTGRNTRYLAKQGFQVMGVDKSPDAIEIARIKSPSIKFEVADAREIPFPENAFDAVVCTHVIEHHLEDEIKKIISEIARVTRKGGLLVLSTISSRDSAFGTGKRLAENTYIGLDSFWDGGEIHHFFTRTELVNLLGRYYDLLDIRHSTYHNFDPSSEGYHKIKIAHWHVIGIKR